MRRNKHRSFRLPTVVIDGEQVQVIVAALRYRCAQCCGELIDKGHRLQCKTDPGHRGYIHRDDVRRLRQRQSIEQENLSNIYEIKNGKVTLCQSKD